MKKKPARKYGSRTRRLSVKVTPEIDDAARRRAKRRNVPLSDVLVAALADAFRIEIADPGKPQLFD